MGDYAIVVALLVGLSNSAFARDDGRYVNDPLKYWFVDLTSSKFADSFSVSDVEWDMEDGHYRELPSTLRLEITDAAGLLADSGFERLLRRGRLGARLGEIVGKADDLAFGGLCNGVVGALANGIVRGKLQLFDVGADHDWALVGGDIPVGQTKAIDVQIAIAEILVFLVVEGFQRGGLVGFESRDRALEHRPPI